MGLLRILLVDDDLELAALVGRYLSQHDMEVTHAGDAPEMDQHLSRNEFDLLVLDLMLPGENGLSIARRVSDRYSVIILSARGEETDRIVGLELGADDYLAKPFNPRELVARIRAVLRRKEKVAPLPSHPAFSFATLLLDTANRTLSKNGERIKITNADFALLRIFCEHPHRVLTRDQLVSLSGGDERLPFDRSIDVRITRLRRKIEINPEEPCYIRTVRGTGYLFSPDGCE